MAGPGKSASDMMTSFKEIAGVSTLEFCEYNLKCFVGVTVGYVLYKAFPQYSGLYLWMLLSILLSITHDNNSKVAYDRMKGNILGSAVGLFAFFLHNPPNLVTICIGVALTITTCFFLKLIGVSRTALVAFIIVMLYEAWNPRASMGSSGCGAYSVTKAQKPANITAAVRVVEEGCAAARGKGRSGGRLVAIFHYAAISEIANALRAVVRGIQGRQPAS